MDKWPPERRIEFFRAYLQANPSDHEAWFNLGLGYKQSRDWVHCIEANKRALDISAATKDPAWWNLGIAATAVRDWNLARWAWRGYGLDIPDGDGPVKVDYGSTPVRLQTGEVVWGDRIDPARVAIRSIPFPDSGHRWGDIILHDGQPNGQRQVNDRTYSVFDELERLSASEIPTLSVIATCATNSDSDALVNAFGSARFAAEDWTANVRPLCQACSEGLQSGHDHAGDVSTEREFGIAAPTGIATSVLGAWRDASPTTRGYGVIETIG